MAVNALQKMFHLNVFEFVYLRLFPKISFVTQLPIAHSCFLFEGCLPLPWYGDLSQPKGCVSEKVCFSECGVRL